MKQRLLNLLVALDQLAWVILSLGRGMPDESISAAAWRMESQGKLAGRILRPVIDTLLWFDVDHCRRSWESERDRTQIDGSYRA